jgi:hypothetical protein
VYACMLARLQAPRRSNQRQRHSQWIAPCAGGADGSGSSVAVGLKEAAAKAEDSLRQAGRSAQQALQDAEQQVRYLLVHIISIVRMLLHQPPICAPLSRLCLDQHWACAFSGMLTP